MIKNLKLCFVFFAATLFGISCQANSKNGFKTLFEQEGKDGYRLVLNDSIADIVCNAKKITVSLVGKSPLDSLRQDSVCTIPRNMVCVMQYLVFDPHNFKTDNTVYGHFCPWVSIEILSIKKRRVRIEIDFGLAKWRMFDTDGKLLTQKDMPSQNNLQFLRFMRMLFPNDKTLSLLNQNISLKR